MKTENKTTSENKKIFCIRGKKVILDFGAAELYSVKTKTLRRAVLKNKNRFADESLFTLTQREWDKLKSVHEFDAFERSKTLPMAFNHDGLVMLSNILNSETAINMHVHIIRMLHNAGRLKFEDLLFTIENKDFISGSVFHSPSIQNSIQLN